MHISIASTFQYCVDSHPTERANVRHGFEVWFGACSCCGTSLVSEELAGACGEACNNVKGSIACERDGIVDDEERLWVSCDPWADFNGFWKC